MKGKNYSIRSIEYEVREKKEAKILVEKKMFDESVCPERDSTEKYDLVILEPSSTMIEYFLIRILSTYKNTCDNFFVRNDRPARNEKHINHFNNHEFKLEMAEEDPLGYNEFVNYLMSKTYRH